MCIRVLGMLLIMFLSRCHDAQDKLMVYAFLSTECPLSIEQTYALKNAYQQHGQQVQFYAVFPNSNDVADTIQYFAQKYQLAFHLIADPEHRWVDSLQATVTPQVFLLDAKGTILYAGQIDNRMLSLGRKRKLVTQHYLEQAIEEALEGKKISVSKTNAVGCSIFHQL